MDIVTFPLPVTLTYVALLGLVFTILSFGVALYRRNSRISGGDGGDKTLRHRMRGHGNFTEYMPYCLILLAGLELTGYPLWVLHAMGIALVIARLMHGWAFWQEKQIFIGRFIGASTTLFFIPVASVMILVKLVL